MPDFRAIFPLFIALWNSSSAIGFDHLDVINDQVSADP